MKTKRECPMCGDTLVNVEDLDSAGNTYRIGWACFRCEHYEEEQKREGEKWINV